jgi:hypothetical protein
MNTLENNKLIAEFFGGKYKNQTNIPLNDNQIWLPKFGVCDLGNNGKVLKFHNDWNWLIQVVDKIYEMDLYYDKYIDYNSSMISNGKINLGTRINRVYEQVVEFIKWYNEQKN